MGKVVLSGFLKVPPSQHAETLAALELHIALTRKEPGCLKFEVETDNSDPNRLKVDEEFVDAAAFQLHQTRAQASAWGRFTSEFERDYQIEGLDD